MAPNLARKQCDFQQISNNFGSYMMSISAVDESLTSLAVYFRNWHMFREYMNNVTC